ncbi:MAG: hypothetical protein VB144_09740 [Clostridia bacterium]|nr:hypothetical protein [Clostridia bacterium]
MRDVKTIKVGTSPSRQETTKYTWDGRGNLVTTIDPAGRKTESWYDDRYALLTMCAEETTAPDGSRAARVLENKLDSDKKAVEEQWTCPNKRCSTTRPTSPFRFAVQSLASGAQEKSP